MNRTTVFHKTIISKCLKSYGWNETADHESGSTYFKLGDDTSVKFRISDHFFAAFYDSNYQLILSDFQPNQFVFIIHGNLVVCNSIKEVKDYIKSISTLLRCSAKFFSTKGIDPKECDAEYWKNRFETATIEVESLKNKLVGRQAKFNKEEREKVAKIKQKNESLEKKAIAHKEVINTQTESIKKLKAEIKALKDELKASKKVENPTYKIIIPENNENTAISNVG